MFTRKSQFNLERLEDRMMMAGDAMAFYQGANFNTTYVPTSEGAAYYSTPNGSTGSHATELYDPSLLSDPERDLFMGLPLLDSNPGAPRTIHLDFTGHSMNSFTNHRGTFPLDGMPIVTPAYSTDVNPNNFSAQEQEEIRQIWARVAEDFAPFNVNVTTHYYGELTDGKALKVAIGGHPNDWYINWEESSETPPGTSSFNSFSDPNKPNVVFVFSTDLWFAASSNVKDNDGRSINMVAAVANTASHEAGHAFGLEHLAKYVNGEMVDEYDGGTAEWTPIMGDNLASDRTTWGYGPTSAGPNVYQNDVHILGSVLGYRADDHVGTRAGATQLTISNSTSILAPMTGKGIIGQHGDLDVFKFTSLGGSVQVQVKAAQFGPNLWLKAQLWNETGLVAEGKFGASNFETIVNANVPAGKYYVSVQGYGLYGHLGQYTVSVKNDPLPSKNTTVKGGTIVGPVGPLTTTKTTSTTTKGTTSVNTMATKTLSSDGNSNEPVYVVTPTNSLSPLGGITAKSKQAPLTLALTTSLKDAAFESLYRSSLRR